MAAGLRHNRLHAFTVGLGFAIGRQPEVSLKQFIFRLLGKDPEAVVVSFLSGPESLAAAMLAEARQLVPDREHYAITELSIPGVCCIHPADLPGPLRRKRIGLAPTMFTGERTYAALRWKAFRMAPFKILAYNAHLERHHLKLRTFIASVLFVRGVPLDRIFLRPRWLCPWKKDRSRFPSSHEVFEGRPLDPSRKRVAILTPYFPYPLSHGGAVRMYHLLQEAARDFDVFLFAFNETASAAGTPVLDLCAKVVLFPNPRYREPRWSTLLPPEVCEYRSPYVARIVDEFRRLYDLQLLQVEYTQMASYGGDVLVEHDVTFDLFDQIRKKERTASAWWNWWRWNRFEKRVISKYRRVVVMSDKDAALLGTPNAHAIPNGVDLRRFIPTPERKGARLLFVGSFRHFPNVIAYRFFVEQVWPRLVQRFPALHLTVIAGPDPHLYWDAPSPHPRIEVHGFISDVRPFYAESNVVIVPTQVSAGTNLKVLEAMASARAVISTTSGCAGLGLVHGESVWIADTAQDFASGVTELMADGELRSAIAKDARHVAEKHFGWERLGVVQRRLWMELITGVAVRPGRTADLPVIERIQALSHSASHWPPASYFEFEVRVAEKHGEVVGFLVSRQVLGEVEVLNLAVDPSRRRLGAATALLDSLDARDIFLEVRESNEGARKLYWKLGFRVVGTREQYYDDPVENALVMRLSRSGESATV